MSSPAHMHAVLHMIITQIPHKAADGYPPIEFKGSDTASQHLMKNRLQTILGPVEAAADVLCVCLVASGFSMPTLLK